MSEIKQTNSPFLEVCDCGVDSTQQMSGFLSESSWKISGERKTGELIESGFPQSPDFSRVASPQPDLSADQQAIADPTTIPFDHSSYAAAHPLFVSLLTRGESSQERFPSLTPTDVASLFEFIQQLRCSNTNLLETVVQLQQALADCQDDLALQKEHKLTTELMLTQKLDDVADAEDQVECLSEKLKTAHQTVQRQQISIKTLTTQLATSQERIAQMERECSLSAAKYNEKSQTLLATEDSCRELRARLVRQQRYTMQLKVALEKCQDLPLRSFATQQDSDCLYSVTNEQTIYEQAPSLFPKAQPITPWVEQSLYLNEVPTIASSSVSSQTHYEQRLIKDDRQSTLFNSSSFSVEQSFFFTRDLDAQSDANWHDLSNLLDAEESETDNRADLSLEYEDLAQGGQLNRTNWADSHINSEHGLPQTNQFHYSDATQPKAKPSQVNPNWPSPVVAQSHPSKGRKSLSAIELPNFVQKRK